MFGFSEKETIKKIVEEFLKKGGFNAEASVSFPEEGTARIDLRTDEPKTLVGEAGQTLADFQRLIKLIVRREIPEISYVDLDVNNYKKKKAEYLKELANSTADDAVIVKKERELPPMPAYERRVIHMELSKREDVKTESSGEGKDRKIVIKPL